MILDIKTGEIYGHILWADEHIVMFDASHGESAITADEWNETQVLQSEDETTPSFAVDRFQVIDPLNVTTPVRIEERRATLRAYAASNNGVVHVHQPQERPSRVSRFARYGRGLFGLPG